MAPVPARSRSRPLRSHCRHTESLLSTRKRRRVLFHTRGSVAAAIYRFTHISMFAIPAGGVGAPPAVINRKGFTMKTALKLMMCLLLCVFIYQSCPARVLVWHQNVQHSSVNLRGAPVVLAQQTIHVPQNGTVLVQFDGYSWSSPGDRIILAASDTPTWHSNDGMVMMKAYSSGVPENSFSHSQVYPVSPGSYTFYAVGENYVQTGGSGYAGIYGTLVVKYFPEGPDEAFVTHSSVIVVDEYMRDAVDVVGACAISVDVPGNVLVRFDGTCVATPGDRILMAARNLSSLPTNDGLTAFEPIDEYNTYAPFSHSRMYSVEAGEHTFLALAQNHTETEGNGIASIYGNLIVEFFPTPATDAFVVHTGISESSIYVRGAPVTMGQLTIDAATQGTAVVRYEGVCFSSPGDRILQAASDDGDWGTNDDNVPMEALSSDVNLSPFSHTRVYTIDAGEHTFYAVCENFPDMDGSGIASNYASLSVEFFPGVVTAAENDVVPGEFLLEQNYPNPFNPTTTITFDLPVEVEATMLVYDLQGRLVKTLIPESSLQGHVQVEWDGTNAEGSPVASGVYFYCLKAGERTLTRKMVLVK